MRRVLLFIAVVAGFLAFNLGTSVASAATCGNTLPADGFPGVHWTSGGGGTLHTATIKVSCPTQGTAWNLISRIQIRVNATLWIDACANSFCDTTRAGFGDAQFSFGYSGQPCDTTSLYRTHVVNLVTGGTVNRPTGGDGVHLNC